MADGALCLLSRTPSVSMNAPGDEGLEHWSKGRNAQGDGTTERSRRRRRRGQALKGRWRRRDGADVSTTHRSLNRVGTVADVSAVTATIDLANGKCGQLLDRAVAT